MRMRRVEMKRRGPRMAPEKVRRKRLYHLSPTRIVVLFSFFFNCYLKRNLRKCAEAKG